MNFKINPFINETLEIDGQDGWDVEYINRTIVDAVEKVGKEDTDFVIYQKTVDDKVNIREFINSQASQCGVEYFMKRVANGLEVVPEVSFSDGITDVSEAPTSLMEAKALNDKMHANFNKLPKDLVNGMSIQDFLTSVSPEDVIKYFANKAAKENTDVTMEDKK